MMYSFKFESIDKFKEEAYKMVHNCGCGGAYEIFDEETHIQISEISLTFADLHILICLECGKSFLPVNTSKLIASAYKQAIDYGETKGEFWRKDYRERFNYCIKQDFIYDHYDDYYNIPGLSCDYEHSEIGFLTPVFFDKKVFQQFMLDDDYRVHLVAETYGDFRMKNEWGIPFGINMNGKVVFWLGDLEGVDDTTLARMKPYNVDSDHKLISSEFYTGQMCCIWAKPNHENRIFQQRNELYNLFQKNMEFIWIIFQTKLSNKSGNTINR